MGKKGYKLTSATGGGPKICAFFFSDKGCRNGADCKFSHSKAVEDAPSPPSVSSSSFVSTDSESDGEIVENLAGAYASLKPENEVVREVDPKPFTDKKQNQERRQQQSGGKDASGNIFDLGTSNSQSTPTKTKGDAVISPGAASPPAKRAKDKRKKPDSQQDGDADATGNIFDLGNQPTPAKKVNDNKKKPESKPDGNVDATGNVFDLGNQPTPVKKAKLASADTSAPALPQSLAAAATPRSKKPKRAAEIIADLTANKKPKQAAGASPAKNTGAAAPPKDSAAAAAPQTRKADRAAATPRAKARHPPNANDATPPNSNKSNAGVVDFRSLQLPIAPFSLPITPGAAAAEPTTPGPSSSDEDPAPPLPVLPLPTATAGHLKWKDACIATRKHRNYSKDFNYDLAQRIEAKKGISSPHDWITARPYGEWCASNPAAIAIDCEMCETRHPVTRKTDPKALCRISVVNADNPSEVLLDTLVKPDWPVSDYRTWVNGISAKELKDVKFTLKHAQQFMDALCSEQTLVVGHAVHNDLLALRMVHHCNVDTAMLFKYTESALGTPSLKNLAHGVLKREMPEVHDSVNDARVALECAEHYVEKKGNVEPVEKVFKKAPFNRSNSNGRRSFNGKRSRDERNDVERSRSRSAERPITQKMKTEEEASVLLVHRLPKNSLPEHISQMFSAFTNVEPTNVPEITFTGQYGKCHVEFSNMKKADQAFERLSEKEREDKAGMKQKRVRLKKGGYVCVRKMHKGR